MTPKIPHLYLLLASTEEVWLGVSPEENPGDMFVLLTVLCRTNDVNPWWRELDGLRSVDLVEVDTGGLSQHLV